MKVSPSILNSDYLSLSGVLKTLEEAKTDMLHLDVMDGSFVPNISFGVPVIKSIARHTSLPLDVHLMIDNPARYIKTFAEFAHVLNIHLEADENPEKTLKEIRALGCHPAITIKPGTDAKELFPLLDYVDMVLVMSVEPGFGGQRFMMSALDKIALLKAEITRRELKVKIEVDGGVNSETALLCANAGADIAVAGSFLFSSENVALEIEKLHSI